MSRQVCSPRIVGRFFVALAVMLLSSTFVFAQTRNNTAAAPQSRVQLDGELEILHKDSGDGRSSYSYILKKSDGTRVPLQFTKNPPTHLFTGARVRASGQLVGGNLVLYSGGPGSTSLTTSTTGSSLPLPNTLGVQSTLVILVNFQDDATQPYPVSVAQNLFFVAANDYFMEASYGQTSLTGTVVGWYTIPESVTTCDTTQIATDAQNAAIAAGVKLSNYTRYVYAFPQNNICGFAGASYVGGNPSQSWINGDTLQIATVTHELGHAFGLWHSHLLDCGSTATIGTNCAIAEYGDIIDVMGASQPSAPHYNAFQKERLGWLNYGASPSIQTIQTSGTYAVNTYEMGGPGPNALKVLKSSDSTTGAKTWYYIEARQGSGFDGFLTNGACSNCWNQTVTDGVLLHIGTDSNGNSGDLLDMTPGTPSYYWYFDPTLIVGQSFQDATAGVSIIPITVTSSGATVQITMNGSSCVAASPTVTVSPSQSQSVSPGTPVNFAISIKDNDSSSCAPATFNLGDYLPSGWSGGLSTSTLALSPGNSGSATVTATSPMGTANGYYSLTVSATNTSASSYNGSATATYVISSTVTQSVGVIASPSLVSAGQTVAVGVTVLSNGTPSAGTSVTVSVTPPSGRTQTMTATTNTSGAAAFNYKVGKRAVAGTYQVQAYITPGTKGAAMIGASTTFDVQ